MIKMEDFDKILFFKGNVDFRKRRRSLAVVVQHEMQEDPFSRTLFLFLNRSKTCLRALYWRGTGFAMWELELEKEKFPLPRKMQRMGSVEITEQQLNWLLSGINFWEFKQHENLNYSLVF